MCHSLFLLPILNAQSNMIRSIKTILCSIKMVLLQLNQTKLRIFLVFGQYLPTVKKSFTPCRCNGWCMLQYANVFHSTLEYGINVQVVISVQVGYFLQNNKHTGLNKRTGGNFENKNLTLEEQFYVKQLKGNYFLVLI